VTPPEYPPPRRTARAAGWRLKAMNVIGTNSAARGCQKAAQRCAGWCKSTDGTYTVLVPRHRAFTEEEMEPEGACRRSGYTPGMRPR